MRGNQKYRNAENTQSLCVWFCMSVRRNTNYSSAMRMRLCHVIAVTPTEQRSTPKILTPNNLLAPVRPVTGTYPTQSCMAEIRTEMLRNMRRRTLSVTTS